MADLKFPLNIPQRTEKPRIKGLTGLYDIGMPIEVARGHLEDFGCFIDIAKVAVGTGYVMPRIVDKIALYKEHGCKVHFGGTLFEKFFYQGKESEFIDFLVDRGADTLEISDGTIEIPETRIHDLIKAGKDRGLTVLVEFGSKDPEKIISPSRWVDAISGYIANDADYVITESRDSGSAGMFRPSGELRTGLVEDIAKAVDISKIIFEAPTPQSQMYFINAFGSNVNLANVKPNDILVLEAQRLGLRYETFHLSE